MTDKSRRNAAYKELLSAYSADDVQRALDAFVESCSPSNNPDDQRVFALGVLKAALVAQNTTVAQLGFKYKEQTLKSLHGGPG